MPLNFQEFKVFAARFEFEVITSSPSYAKSNGKAENAIIEESKIQTSFER